MSHSLSRDCSFLDLTDDDSGYDSSTASCDDEPLDALILPLPRRKTTSSPSGPQGVYHNQSFFNLAKSREAKKMLALSDIAWPLPNYEVCLSSQSVDVTTASLRQTQPRRLKTSFSTPPATTFQALRRISRPGSENGSSTASSSVTLNAASENDVYSRPGKIVSFTWSTRKTPEVFRGSVPISLPSLPVVEGKTPASHTLLVTHTSPFIARPEITTPSSVEEKVESVIGGALAIELLSPADFSKQPFLEKQPESKKNHASVSIITSPISLINREGYQTITHQSVKRHSNMKKNKKEVVSGSFGRKSSTLTANQIRTRTASNENSHDKENQRDQFKVDLTTTGLGTIVFPMKISSRKLFD